MMYFGVEKHIAISPTNIPVRNSGTQLSIKLVATSLFIANLYNCKYSLKLVNAFMHIQTEASPF